MKFSSDFTFFLLLRPEKTFQQLHKLKSWLSDLEFLAPLNSWAPFKQHQIQMRKIYYQPYCTKCPLMYISLRRNKECVLYPLNCWIKNFSFKKELKKKHFSFLKSSWFRVGPLDFQILSSNLILYIIPCIKRKNPTSFQKWIMTSCKMQFR